MLRKVRRLTSLSAGCSVATLPCPSRVWSRVSQLTEKTEFMVVMSSHALCGGMSVRPAQPGGDG